MLVTLILCYDKNVSLHFLGRGKPVEIKSRTSQISQVSADSLPDEGEAKTQYQQYYTGTLTDEHSFGSGPLHDNDDLRNRRDQSFFQKYNIESLFQDCSHSRTQSLKEAIIFYIDTTFRLSQQV